MTKLWRWLSSGIVREALALSQGARRVLAEQRDLLEPKAISTFERTIDSLDQAAREGETAAVLRARMNELQEAANTCLRPYSHAVIRENVCEIQSAFVKVLAIFCFFLQPMAIPSGSAQPTLYGITHVNGKDHPELSIPGTVRRLFEACFLGTRYYQVVAAEEGMLQEIEEPKQLFPLIKRQRLRIGEHWHNVWFPPDELAKRAGLFAGKFFRKGDDVLKLKVTAGDHLFVDRFTYNFRRPNRGEIIVFASAGVPGLIPDTHYIKRLVALGGERVRIGNDRHLVINGARLDSTTPRFEKVYSFDGPPTDSVYSGHVNDLVGRRWLRGGIAPLFKDENEEFTVRPGHYLTMGDNTMNSHDSRAWGDFPQEKVIGKAAFVFWPFSSRFAWGFD